MPIFFFNDTATTEIYTLSLHDALPIYLPRRLEYDHLVRRGRPHVRQLLLLRRIHVRSEEHTSELQSQSNLVCRLLLEKKNTPPSQLGESSTNQNHDPLSPTRHPPS